MCSAALTIPSSQAFSLLDVEVPIKVPEETVQVVQMCELLAFKPLVLYVNKEPSGQLSTMRFLVVKSARDARNRAPRASVACVNDHRRRSPQVQFR